MLGSLWQCQWQIKQLPTPARPQNLVLPSPRKKAPCRPPASRDPWVPRSSRQGHGRPLGATPRSGGRIRDARGRYLASCHREGRCHESRRVLRRSRLAGAQMTDAGRRRRGRPEDGSLIPSWVGAPSDRSRASDHEELPPTVSPSRAFHEAAPATAAGPRRAGAAPEGRTCGAARRRRGCAARRSPWRRTTSRAIMAPTLTLIDEG